MALAMSASAASIVARKEGPVRVGGGAEPLRGVATATGAVGDGGPTCVRK